MTMFVVSVVLPLGHFCRIQFVVTKSNILG
jgi:hypothetical protein